jgi:hypothetical protein
MKHCGSKDLSPTSVSKFLLYGSNNPKGEIQLKLPFKSFRKLFPDSNKEEFYNFLKVASDDLVAGVEPMPSSDGDGDSGVVFNLNRNMFLEDILLNRCPSERDSPKENIVLDYRLVCI